MSHSWFYTLMVLSTALFGKPAFQDLICNGLVLADDGKKRDAVLLYLINSPVTRAEPLRFKKEGVYGVFHPCWGIRLSLILSKTVSLEVDWSVVKVEFIDEVYCQDDSGNRIYIDELQDGSKLQGFFVCYGFFFACKQISNDVQ
ncbi:hypothetical protein M0R45_019646 [Rubus argutus]|uniref:Aminoacyl-tRNA synthetase class Ia domain-containing protein n=1 Tax=Rubus argutus TaxID=59490 RepID=A0AAW1X6P6_RUBAR